MAAYQLTDTDIVIRTYDGASIPNDPLNRDWVEYQEWLAVAGNVPDPYIAPPPVVYVDANLRIDAGIAAAVTVAVAVRDAVNALPANFSATNYEQLLVQMKTLAVSFVAMLEAQNDPQLPP